MRTYFSVLFWVSTLFATAAQAQTATQTVRGTVLDAAAKAPVIGATVVVLGVEPALGTSTPTWTAASGSWACRWAASGCASAAWATRSCKSMR